MNNKPIGVFDSGIGGLTVVKNITQLLPQEDIIYFGDIARLPYGIKSVETINRFTKETVQFLLSKNVKAIVIACNTISAVAKETVIKLAGNIPVIDVISSGSEACIYDHKDDVDQAQNKIGIIATPATINSQAYTQAILKLSPKATIVTQACSLFVPLIESGMINHKALELIAIDYLTPLKAENLNCLILGCTHYPLIKHVIQKIIGHHIKIIDPAVNTSLKLYKTLKNNNLLNTKSTNGRCSFFVTEISQAFRQIGETFLEKPISPIELVSFD